MKTLLLSLLALTACTWDDDRPIAWERDRTVLGPIPLKTQVAYVDSALDRVTLLDLGPDVPVLTTRDIGRRAITATPSADKHYLFVITRGEEAISLGQIDEDPQFWSVDTQSTEAAPVAYAIGSPFDRIAIAPDNSIAIAYFSASGPDSTGFFRNPNELAVIDLTRPPGPDNPTLKTIRSFGSVPEGIVLSPPMSVPGSSDATARTFAFVLSQNNLTVLDATNASRREISIRLDLAETAVMPKEIVFAPHTASAYVRSDNARDVLQVLLVGADPTAEGNGNDYRPQLAELGAGGGPTDIAVYDDARGRRTILAATPNTGEIVVIDADTAQFRAIRVSDPIDRILLFNAPGEAPHKALFASITSKMSRVHVLDLAGIEDQLTQARLRRIDLDQSVRDVVPVPGRDFAMLVHDDNRTVIGLLDMETESTSPLLGVGRLDSYDFSPDGAFLIGASPNVARVGFVALDNLHPTDFRLDDTPSRVISAANAKIFVDHGAPLGHATIIPSPTAERADALVLAGFLTSNLLDVEP